MKNFYLLFASAIFAILIFSTSGIASFTEFSVYTHNPIANTDGGEEFPNGGTTDDDEP